MKLMWIQWELSDQGKNLFRLVKMHTFFLEVVRNLYFSPNNQEMKTIYFVMCNEFF